MSALPAEQGAQTSQFAWTPEVPEGPGWEAQAAHARARLAHLVVQDPLFITAPSLAGLAQMPTQAPAPRAVFVGIGLASNDALSAVLPLDVLGMLLAAEQARRAAGAAFFTLLIADAHAVQNGLSPEAVAQRANSYEKLLRCVVARAGWHHVRFVRAVDLHKRPDYLRLHEAIRCRAPRGEHAYVTREVADIAYFARSYGSILKVGWALGSEAGADRDERGFDARFQQWASGNVGFLYSKAGRALDDRGRKAVPYVESNPARRVCLAADERVHEKLERAAHQVSVSTLRGVRRHLRAIARSYRKLVRPVSGSVEQQVEQMLDDLLGPVPFARFARDDRLVRAS